MFNMNDQEENVQVINPEPSFPGEDEVRKYFLPEAWDLMAEYEKLRYGNILQSYKIMMALCMNPVKPPFMIEQETRTAAAKRKINSTAVCPSYHKKPCLTDIYQQQFSSPMMQQDNPVEWFSPRHQTLSIRMNIIFSAILKAYKKFRRCRRTTCLEKCSSPGRRQKLTIEKFTIIDKDSCRSCGSDFGIEEGNEEDRLKYKARQENVCANEFSCIKPKSHIKSILVQVENEGGSKDGEDQDTNVIRKEKHQINKTITGSLKCSDKQPTYGTVTPQQAKELSRSVQTQTVSAGTTHLASDLVFPCDNCNTPYNSPLYLESHQKLCQGEGAAPARAEPSSKPTDIQSLVIFNYGKNYGKRTYCCHLCPFKTNHRSNFENHLIRHSGRSGYLCHVCGKVFTQASSLTTHNHVHTEEKPFRCSQCSYTCKQAGNLKRHMTRHTGEKMYACPHCSYKTAFSSNIKTHLYTHTAEKPYSCAQCPYRAAQKHDMIRHMRTHTKENPYSCTLCTYKAPQNHDLIRHLRTHLGEKPYACPYCEYRAAQKCNLILHIGRLHPHKQT